MLFVVILVTGVVHAQSSENNPDSTSTNTLGTLLTTLWFGDMSVTVTVDTGATITALSKTLITQLKERGLVTLVGTGEATFANGETLDVPYYTLSRFTIGNCVVENDIVAETFSDDINLLGLYTLIQLGAHINLVDEPPTMYFQHCKQIPVDENQ
jgi:hypothetical protein